MCYACDYCESALPGGQLRMVPDPSIGGASQRCCHGCWHTHGDLHTCADPDDCEWLSHQTADEWAADRQALAEAAADDKAHAKRSSLAEWVMFG